jgi:hypothetical protein
MSIERGERKDGEVVWRVRWRQAGRNRSKVLKETLAEFGDEWWKLYGEPNVAASTLQVYASAWDAHILRGSDRCRRAS